MQSEGISDYENYPCFAHLSRNEVIISRASLDGMESERSVGRNRARSSLVQDISLVIGISQGYCLDNEDSSLSLPIIGLGGFSSVT